MSSDSGGRPRGAGSESDARSSSGERRLTGAEVLVIDRDERVLRGMSELLAEAGLHVTTFAEPEPALELLRRKFFSVAVIDVDTPRLGAGLATIAETLRRSRTTMVVALTPRRSFDDALAALRAGASDVVVKSPESVGYLEERVLQAAGRSVGSREVDSVLAEVRDVHEDFLKRFMDSERQAQDLSDQLARQNDATDPLHELIHVLVVDPDITLVAALAAAAPRGFRFESVQSGGQALDHATSSPFHIALVRAELPDLPGRMVVKSLKEQAPDTVTVVYTPPGPGGKVDLVESSTVTPVIAVFSEPAQLISRLNDLADVFRTRAKDRRYVQAFREKHYEFLRRYVELKMKLDRAVGGR